MTDSAEQWYASLPKCPAFYGHGIRSTVLEKCSLFRSQLSGRTPDDKSRSGNAIQLNLCHLKEARESCAKLTPVKVWAMLYDKFLISFQSDDAMPR